MKKRIISLALCLCMLVGIFAGLVVTAHAVNYAVHTQDEAVSWLQSQDGASYDFGDFGNYVGTQCPEFIRAYVNWLVNDNPWADAWGGSTYDGSNIWENPIWNRLGWEVHENTLDFMPQPGDIFSAGQYHYGGIVAHTGVVVSSDLNTAEVADANARDANDYNGDPVWVHTISWRASGTDASYGATHYIRPKFANNIEDFRPSKPSLTVFDITPIQEKDAADVTFSWQETENTTHYNLWVYQKTASGGWQEVVHDNYITNGITKTLEPGEYYAVLQAYNSNYRREDGLDWLCTVSDECYFNIAAHEHTWGSGTVTTAATCTTSGVRTYTCTD